MGSIAPDAAGAVDATGAGGADEAADGAETAALRYAADASAAARAPDVSLGSSCDGARAEGFDVGLADPT